MSNQFECAAVMIDLVGWLWQHCTVRNGFIGQQGFGGWIQRTVGEWLKILWTKWDPQDPPKDGAQKLTLFSSENHL